MANKIIFFLLLTVTVSTKVLTGQDDLAIDALNELISEKPLDSAVDTSVANGLRLPPEILALTSDPWREPASYPEGDPWRGTQPYSRADSFDNLSQKEIRAVELWYGHVQSGGADKFFEFIESHSNRLPPTETDYVLFRLSSMLLTMMREASDPAEFKKTTVGSWEALIDSSNPVYRYLALHGIHFSISEEYEEFAASYGYKDPRLAYLTAGKKFEVYKKYFNETDSNLLYSLYRFLGAIPLVENVEYLRSQLEAHEKVGDERFNAILLESIENVERLLASQPEDLPIGWNASGANTEIPGTAPEVEEVAEVIEEVTAPEPTIEEPAEVVVTEPVEEDVEQSSNWLLWLIGAVVLVGGVFVLRSRK